jgi:spore coat polysaccharide biosynthesis protein SpsF
MARVLQAGDVAGGVEPIWAIVTARMGSTRLPGKSMAVLAGRPSLAHIVARLRSVPQLSDVVVATTDREEDDVICECAEQTGARCFRGSSEDVLSRVHGAAHSVDARTVVLITGDCPMIDPAVVSRVIEEYRRERPDYASSVLTEDLTYPAGHSCEIFPRAVLDDIDKRTVDPTDREHVTLHVYRHPARYRLYSIEATGDEVRPDLWLSLDNDSDLSGISAIFDALAPLNPLFGYRDVLAYLADHPEVAEMNRADGRR